MQNTTNQAGPARRATTSRLERELALYGPEHLDKPMFDVGGSALDNLVNEAGYVMPSTGVGFCNDVCGWEITLREAVTMLVADIETRAPVA